MRRRVMSRRMNRLIFRRVRSSSAAYLCEQGYVVIRGVANASELAHARELLWAFLELEP